MDTLVLNRYFYAIQIAGWQRAFSLLYAGQASVVDEEYRTYDFESWKELSATMTQAPAGFVHTARYRIAIPDVIALRHYDRLPPMQVKFTRRNIYEHYGYRCCYCGKRFKTEDLNLDHILPRSRGGSSDWNNVVTACISCNTRKANRLPHEAGMQFKVPPSKPRWNGPAALMFRSGRQVRASWQKFIDTVYWDGELKE